MALVADSNRRGLSLGGHGGGDVCFSPAVPVCPGCTDGRASKGEQEAVTLHRCEGKEIRALCCSPGMRISSGCLH